MNKINIFIIVCIFFIVMTAISISFGQNGKIVKRETVDIISKLIEADSIKQPDTLNHFLKKVIVEEITYLSDELKVKGYLVYPKEQSETYPCIIYNRGGNKDFGAITPRKTLLLARIASWGYVVVGSQYRGNNGGEGLEEFGGKDVNDVLNLIPLLNEITIADTSRMGVLGWSRGGMMTYLTLAKSSKFKAAVVGGGLSDLVLMKEDRPIMEEVYEELIPGYNKNKDSLLSIRSAISWPNKICKTTPILMLHGTADWRVEPKQSLNLADAFINAKQPFRLIMFEGGDHGLNEFNNEVYQEAKNWFDYYLRDEGKLPNLEPHGR